MSKKNEAVDQQGSKAIAQKNRELVSSEQRYYKMIDEVLDYAIILLDKDGIIQNWNKGAEKIKMYTEEEAVGKHFSMFYLSEDRSSGLPGQLLNLAATEGRAIHEGWRLRKDGSRFWGSITLTALHGEDNKIIGFSKVTRDLTERKKNEDRLKEYTEELRQKNEALRISEERYHKMIAEVQDYAIIFLDKVGNIQNWNTGAEKIKGYKAEEILGKNFATFYTQEDRERNLPQQLLDKATLEGKAIHEGWRVKKNGSTFWGSIVITALHAEDGSIIGFSKVTRDLTDKKEAEDRLREYLVELEKQNVELDQFAYAASHDLQEPLRKIVTFAGLIEQNVGDEKAVRKFAEKITASSRRMSDLIRAVLDYSQLAKDVTNKVETDLNRVLSDVLMDYELLIQQKDADIEFDPLPLIQAIPLQINQLFSNLIGNALKFANPHPVIRISCAIVEKRQLRRAPVSLPDGKYLQLLFADNGIGFDPQYEQMIFSLFQRLHAKHEYSGTGIGLALCKKVMDNHGGWITAEGDPGKGASFYLYFPMA
jgi:PAS domain S-box-containing protein